MNTEKALELIDFTNLKPECKTFVTSACKQLEEKNGEIQVVDINLLQMMAKDYHTYLMCVDTIHLEGITITGATGVLVKHPAVSVQSLVSNAIRSALRDLGITGVSKRHAPAPNLLAESKLLEALNG